MPTCGVPVGDGQKRTRTSLMGSNPTRAAPSQDRAPGLNHRICPESANPPPGCASHTPGRARVIFPRVAHELLEEVPGLLRSIWMARVPGVLATCDLLQHGRRGEAAVAVGRDVAVRGGTRRLGEVTLVPGSELTVHLVDGEVGFTVTGTAVVVHDVV